MLAKVLSGATIGLNATLIEVEVDIASQGLPSFTIVGLPDKAVEESKERVRSAIKNSGADFPIRRITVNLAPADLPKAGPVYDLPIAIGILIASGQIAPDNLDSLYFGELSLDGKLRHSNGILSITYLAWQKKIQNLFIPQINEREASVVGGLNIYPVDSLTSLVRFINKTKEITPARPIDLSTIISKTESDFDFSEILGQEQSKRVLEIAAAGGHNVFLRGSPGSGKTMLARALPGILPSLTPSEALEVTKIYSITGNLPDGQSLITKRPFRCPHHTTSRVGMVGGGSNLMPGEISLAHRGVLFLDEFPEFPRSVIEALRQPMEDGVVSISRAKGSINYPAKFTLIASANPCPCGYFGDPKRECKCLPGTILRYQNRISGPILDRIDLHMEVPSEDIEKITNTNANISENSEKIRARVQNARNIQIERFEKLGIKSNSEMQTRHVKEICTLNKDTHSLMIAAAAKMNLSVRSYFKTLKIARTIADLDGSTEIGINHVAEALQYRPKIYTI